VSACQFVHDLLRLTDELRLGVASNLKLRGIRKMNTPVRKACRRVFGMAWPSLFVFAVLTLAPASGLSQPRMSAANVHRVDFGENGRMLGAYAEVGPGMWDELNAKGQAVFHYRENRRDAYTINLYDAARKVSIQINLDRMKIIYSTAGSGSARDLYDIMRPEPARRAEVSGANVLWFRATTNGPNPLTYRKSGRDSWEEVDVRGAVTHRYMETGHGPEVLTLADPSRKMTLEVNLRRKTVTSIVAGRAFDHTFEILEAGAEEMRDGGHGYDR